MMIDWQEVRDGLTTKLMEWYIAWTDDPAWTCENWEYARMIIEEIQAQGLVPIEITIYRQGRDCAVELCGMYYGRAKSVPQAICLAAANAVGLAGPIPRGESTDG